MIRVWCVCVCERTSSISNLSKAISPRVLFLFRVLTRYSPSDVRIVARGMFCQTSTFSWSERMLSSLAAWENGCILPHQLLWMSQLSFVDRNWSMRERQGYSVLPIDSPCPSAHPIRTFENDLHRWLSRSSVTLSVRLCSLNPQFSLWWLIINKSRPIRRCIRWPTWVKRERKRTNIFSTPIDMQSRPE